MGPVPTPSQWARIQLAQGQSTAGMWDLSSQVPEARVTVGSAPPAGWIIDAPGVMPVHFEFYWDGTSLWVSPPQAGDLTVDGERVTAWRQLAGRCRIEFGRAALMVESSQSIAMPGGAPAARPSAPPPAPPIDDFDADDATMMLPADAAQLEDIPGDATQMLDPSALEPVGRPGLGGKPGLGAPAIGAPSVGLFGSDAGGAQDGELRTQILDTEAMGILPSDPPPSPGGPAPMPGLGGTGPGDGRPTLMAGETDLIPRAGDTSGGDSQKFAMPPIPTGDEDEGGMQLPPRRTLILLAVTVVVAIIGVSIMSWKNSQNAEIRARNAAAARAEAQREQAEAARAEVAEANAALRAARDQREEAARSEVAAAVEAIVSRARSEALEDVDDEATDEEVEGVARAAVRVALEKRAAELVVNNNFPHALAFYQKLQTDFPSENYAAIIEVIRRRMR